MSYQEKSLASAGGVDLVVSLYDGCIRFLYRAMRAVEEDEIVERRYAVKRSLDILMYLQSRLRPDVGSKAADALSEFYSAMFALTLEASHAASSQQFLHIIKCVRHVREAWAQVARDPETNRTLPRELRTTDQPRMHSLAPIVAVAGEPGRLSLNV